MTKGVDRRITIVELAHILKTNKPSRGETVGD